MNTHRFAWACLLVIGCSGGGGFIPRRDGGVGGDMAMMAASCGDGMKDGKETDVDCGGGCMPCADGRGCTLGSDCESQVCLNAQCAAPSCSDKFKNGSESDVDCGGGVCDGCANGRACKGNGDCQSQFCDQGTCKQPPCQDGMRDGNETDIDCGGGACAPCTDGRHCNNNNDCQSGNCSAGTCQAQATCVDGIKNGQETDVDCGGPNCNPCINGLACLGNNDCGSFNCSNGLCCGNGAANCDGSVFNGCEVTLASDPKNCGTCGHVCPNNTPVCANSQCTAVAQCDANTEVANGGHCYYLDGSGGLCDFGYALASQAVLNNIAASFAGKNYKHKVSSNCCIENADAVENWGMTVHCNMPGPFSNNDVALGGAGCNGAMNKEAGQLTLCFK